MEALEKHKRTLMPMRSDERLAQRIATDVLPRYPVSSILDIGCGDGVVSHQLPAGIDYQGLDIDEACIYKQDINNPAIMYIKAAQIPGVMQKNGPWDMVLLLDVIEHTPNFTHLFEHALENASKYVVVSLPNELFILDRARMLAGKELNAHSLDLLGKPEGFKHQFIINIEKAKKILRKSAESKKAVLQEEVLRPLVTKNRALQVIPSVLRPISSPNLWSMGSVLIFSKKNL